MRKTSFSTIDLQCYPLFLPQGNTAVLKLVICFFDFILSGFCCIFGTEMCYSAFTIQCANTTPTSEVIFFLMFLHKSMSCKKNGWSVLF